MGEEFVFKLVGSIIVILASLSIGIKLSENLNTQLELLRKMKQLIILISGEIKYNNSYLGQAFLNVSARIGEPYKSLLKEVVEELDKENGDSFEKIWKSCVEKNLSNSGIHKRFILKLQELGETIGFLDKDMQLSNFNLFIERLDCEIEECVNRNNTDCRLYRSLGIMSGVAIVILLI